MSDEMILRHCSPTLAGMKTGSLFAENFSDESEMRTSLRRWNRRLSGKGLRVLPLKFQNNRALIYVYRPSRLSRDLRDDRACGLLEQRGYGCGSPEACILQLRRRLRENDEFPHEIGLFLGYPPEDVSGFIENRGADCKCVGCWKVYGDADAAKKTFAKYKKCTDVYCAQHAKGKSIERLTVAG